MRILFLSDTHLGFDLPARARVVRRRRGEDFFRNYETALAPARRREVDVVVHGGDLLYRSRVPAWLAEAALAPLREIAASGIPVLLVPGNHERSRMPYPLLAVDEGLHVFDRPGHVLVDVGNMRVAFLGFPYTAGIRRAFHSLVAAAGAGASAADVRVLCVHQLVEGATCGPADFTFRHGADVIRTRDLCGADLAVTLSGHIHRHQVLRHPRCSPVIYAGSIERTSFAEAAETKGFVVLELTRSGAGAIDFRPLPARPMVQHSLTLFADEDAEAVRSRLAATIGSTPEDAVVQLRITGGAGVLPSAATLRELAGRRNVTLRLPVTQAEIDRERPHRRQQRYFSART